MLRKCVSVLLDKRVMTRRPTISKPKPRAPAAASTKNPTTTAAAASGATSQRRIAEDSIEYAEDEFDDADDGIDTVAPAAKSLGRATAASSASTENALRTIDGAASTTVPRAPEAASSADATSATKEEENSAEAFHFLLDHIDAEIEALQRRHRAATERRQSLERQQGNQLRELFRFMESPWLLLPTAVQPPLPATAQEVYVKEQRCRHQAHSGGRGDAVGKMMLLAWHKNYRTLSKKEKGYYEAAAQHNATLRNEMLRQMSYGCARFESFCAGVVECTADMVRDGSMPLLPPGAVAVPEHAGRGKRAKKRGGLNQAAAKDAGDDHELVIDESDELEGDAEVDKAVVAVTASASRADTHSKKKGAAAKGSGPKSRGPKSKKTAKKSPASGAKPTKGKRQAVKSPKKAAKVPSATKAVKAAAKKSGKPKGKTATKSPTLKTIPLPKIGAVSAAGKKVVQEHRQQKKKTTATAKAGGKKKGRGKK